MAPRKGAPVGNGPKNNIDRPKGRKGYTMKKPNNVAKSTKETKDATAPAFKVDSFAVSRAKCWDNGGVTFDLEVNGIKVYGCRVAEGKNGDFISFPSRKGTDGKYYNHVYIPLGEDDQKAILEAVEAAING